MLPVPVPEIQRTNLAATLLQLKAMGINNLIDFDFMDAPPLEAMITALTQLHTLSALDDDGLLTRLGRRVCNFGSLVFKFFVDYFVSFDFHYFVYFLNFIGNLAC